jgi:hypothetical protein
MKHIDEFGSIIEFKSLVCVCSMLTELDEVNIKKSKNLGKFITSFNYKYHNIINSTLDKKEKVYLLNLLKEDFINKIHEKEKEYDEILLSHIKNFFTTKVKIYNERYVNQKREQQSIRDRLKNAAKEYKEYIKKFNQEDYSI